MVVPDFEAIIEIELSAEGFLAAKIAHKFITLFLLSKELLSKQMHYDYTRDQGHPTHCWRYEARRAREERIQILMRALRDVNLPKFVDAVLGSSSVLSSISSQKSNRQNRQTLCSQRRSAMS